MEFEWKHYFVIGLLFLFVLKALLGNQSFIKQNIHFINLLFFLIIAGYLTHEFYQKELYAGLIAIVLGVLAFGKYFIDTKTDK